MLRVKDEDLDYSDDQVCIFQDKPFSGVSYEMDGDFLIGETTYLNGLRHGLSASWYPSGSKFIVEDFVNNYRHGKSFEWFESGAIKSETAYEYGIVLNIIIFDESGTIVKNYELLASDEGYNILTMRRKRFYS